MVPDVVDLASLRIDFAVEPEQSIWRFPKLGILLNFNRILIIYSYMKHHPFYLVNQL